MWLSRLRTLVRGPRYAGRPAPRPYRWRPQLERLEDRALPSSYTASTTAQLISDINAANAAGGSNTVLLAANTTFDLTSINNTTDGANGLPVIGNKDALTISGNGDTIEAAPPTLGGALLSTFRVFDVTNHAALTLQNLTLQGGIAYGSGIAADGGAILNQGTLTLTAVTVQNNTARGLGGAHASNVNGNGKNGQDAGGGGIWSSGSLTLQSGTVLRGNEAIGGNGGDAYYNGEFGYWGNGNPGGGGNGFGGGLYVAGGTATLGSASLLSNTASAGGGGEAAWGWGSAGTGFGGGLYAAAGGVTLSNSTVASNTASYGLGGGLYVASGATVRLSDDTVQSNTATGSGAYGVGGGIFIQSGATVYLDSYTVTHATSNTDDSGVNGATANIDGTYIPI